MSRKRATDVVKLLLEAGADMEAVGADVSCVYTNYDKHFFLFRLSHSY